MRYIIMIGGSIQGDGAHEDPSFLCHKWFDGEIPDQATLTIQIEEMIVEWEITDIHNDIPVTVFPPTGTPCLNGDGLSLDVQISGVPE